MKNHGKTTTKTRHKYMNIWHFMLKTCFDFIMIKNDTKNHLYASNLLCYFYSCHYCCECDVCVWVGCCGLVFFCFHILGSSFCYTFQFDSFAWPIRKGNAKETQTNRKRWKMKTPWTGSDFVANRCLPYRGACDSLIIIVISPPFSFVSIVFVFRLNGTQFNAWIHENDMNIVHMQSPLKTSN